MEKENCKTVFLNISKKGKSNEILKKKHSLKSIRKGPKKQWLKKCYNEGLLTLLKIIWPR